MKDKFINNFPIPVGNKKEPYIIVFDAYSGQGKSYTSKIISKYDKSIILNNDEVRNWLNNYGNDNSVLRELQLHRLELLLQNNNSCILDSCSCHDWKNKKEYLDKLGYKYYVIRLLCSENTVKERLRNRTIDGDNFSKANYNDYLWMKNNVPNIDDSLIDFTIDTEKDVELQVQNFLNKYDLI